MSVQWTKSCIICSEKEIKKNNLLTVYFAVKVGINVSGERADLSKALNFPTPAGARRRREPANWIIHTIGPQTSARRNMWRCTHLRQWNYQQIQVDIESVTESYTFIFSRYKYSKHLFFIRLATLSRIWEVMS